MFSNGLNHYSIVVVVYGWPDVTIDKLTNVPTFYASNS